MIREIESPDERIRFIVDMIGRPAPTYDIIGKESFYALTASRIANKIFEIFGQSIQTSLLTGIHIS